MTRKSKAYVLGNGGLEGSDNLGYITDSKDGLDKVGPPSGASVVDIGQDKLPEVAVEEDDPWKVSFIKKNYVPWQDLEGRAKATRVLGFVVKGTLALGCLYMFICSLDFLSSAFKLLGGEAAGKIFQESDILTNPIAGLMMGVLVTVLVQSSSTSTSIVVSMVGAGILDIKTAIPIVMGANIGTSVTNTIVAIGQISDKGQFRRAFAGATVHDMFNWLTVIVFLPLEIATGYLYKLSDKVVGTLSLETDENANQDILKVITEPFTKKIIQVNKDAIKDLATDTAGEGYRIMKLCCDKTPPAECCEDQVEDLKADPAFSWWRKAGVYTQDQMDSVCPQLRQCVTTTNSSSAPPGQCGLAWDTGPHLTTRHSLNCSVFQPDLQARCSSMRPLTTQDSARLDNLELCSDLVSATTDSKSALTICLSQTSWLKDESVRQNLSTFSCETWASQVEERTCNDECEYLFRPLHESMSDESVGAVLLVISLLILCLCLVGIVKLLHSLMQGPMATLIKKFINSDFPGPLKYLTGYVAILVGAGLTIVVQSSSIFTSTLTPLVGLGVIEVDRMYPLTLGSNIGTTTTAILSSLASSGVKLRNSLQVAFCHLFFNISGILLFYPIPYLRFPVPLSKFLGNRTASYRWFALVYVFGMFFLLPATIFALSLAGWIVFAAVMCPIALLLILIIVVKVFQAKNPACLPAKLRDWKWLPEPMRSMKPYDKTMRKLFFCKRFEVGKSTRRESIASNGHVMKSF